MVTRDRLVELYHYDPETGHFKSNFDGSVVTTSNNEGYIYIDVDDKLYRAHRLAWLYMTGQHPVDIIDHINGCPSDNRWLNLRSANGNQNQWNRKLDKSNKSGFKGVSWSSVNAKWRSCIYLNNKRIHLGYFNDPKDAAAAYNAKAEEIFGEYARLNAL